MTRHIPSDPRFLDTLSGRLLSGRESSDGERTSGGRTQAAVAVILRPAELSPEILLIRRAIRAADPWSGHMAFPGGRWEESDTSLLATASREAFEEIGIALGESGRSLGRLPAVSPHSAGLPLLSVVPFIFAVPTGTDARCASEEVDEVHWVSVAHLRSEAARTIHRFGTGERARDFPALDVDGNPVWGLTYRILVDFLERLGSD